MTFSDQAEYNGTAKTTRLVLGANGRIGQLLQRCWGRKGAIWQSRSPTSQPQDLCFDPLNDTDSLQRNLEGQSQILCLAGPVPGRAANGGMQDHIRLALACVGAAPSGARVFLASSAAVYGTPTQDAPLQEDSWLAPQSDYGRAKAEMERQAITLGRARGVAVTALRIGNIAGFDAILGGWRTGFTLDQFPDTTTPMRSYIGVLTLADVLGQLMQQPDLPEVLNIAQPPAVEMGALLQAAQLPFTTQTAPATAIANVTLDVTRLTAFVSLDPASPERLVQEWRKDCTQIHTDPKANPQDETMP